MKDEEEEEEKEGGSVAGGEESSRLPSVSNMHTPHSSHINLSHSQQCKTAFRMAKRGAGHGVGLRKM